MGHGVAGWEGEILRFLALHRMTSVVVLGLGSGVWCRRGVGFFGRRAVSGSFDCVRRKGATNFAQDDWRF